MCRSAAALIVVAALCLLAPRLARAQACCAAAGLVAPARLRSYEDYAVGIQGRVRSVEGAFNEYDAYTGNGPADSEWDLEQDLFAVARVLGRGQVALVIPYLQTRRAVSGLREWGQGIGDVTASARYDFLRAGERRIIPGLALLLGVLVPTGTPPESSGGLLGAGATGQGSYQGTIGVGVEQAFEPYFVTINALFTYRSSRSVGTVHESFAPEAAGFIAAGRVLPHGATLGAYVSGMIEGDNHDSGQAIPRSSVSVLTAGLAGSYPLSDQWRLQSTAFQDLPFRGAGQNQTVGIGGSLSLMRLWL